MSCPPNHDQKAHLTDHAKKGIDYSGGFPQGLEVFEVLEDPRNGRATRHYFGEMIFISLAALLCGMDTCEDFVRFAHGRREWLAKWLRLPNGIPCANTFLRLFAAIDPKQFCQCIREFVAQISPELEAQLVALDGKTLRGSRQADQSTVQMVSAWAVGSGLTLAQQAVEEKSNEITAVPHLLRQLDLKNCVVSLDAMGTQRKIAIEIIHAGADYLLALKGNQEILHEEVVAFLQDEDSLKRAEENGAVVSRAETVEKGHGRLEVRRALASDSLEWLDARTRRSWLGLRSLLQVQSEVTLADGTVRRDTRYYLSSLEADAARLLALSRAHWSIENQCHWVLDVVFREDQCRARGKNAAANLSALRRIALNALKADQLKPKEALRGKRIYALMDTAYLESLMGLAKM